MQEVRLGSRTLQPRRQLLAEGERLPVGPRALDVLSVLAEAKGEIVTKDELLDTVWPDAIVEENALQVHIAALRKALGPEAERLKTIRGIGYQLELPKEPAEQPLALREPSPESSAFAEPVPFAPDHAANDRTRSAEALRPLDQPRQSVSNPAWWKSRGSRPLLAVAALLAILLAGWWIAGTELGLRPPERIPVLVRELATGEEGDATQAALASGITDELIVRLRRIPDLRIATALPDGTAPSGAFNNAYVVDGNLWRSGNRLRLNVTLADPSGEVLWSQTFNRGLYDLFEIQEELAAALANALSVSFDVGANAAELGGTDNPEAYAAYMQYAAHMLDFDQSVPVRYLEHAVSLDPGFGKAQSALAHTYGVRASAAPVEEASELLARMNTTSAEALASNSDHWFGPGARGWYFLSTKELASAEQHMRRVAELDRGNDPELRLHLSSYARHLGRFRKAVEIRQSIELIDPIYRNNPWTIYDLMMLGQYRESFELFHHLKGKGVQGLEAFVLHAYLAYLLSGREDEAQRFMDQHAPRVGLTLKDFRATPGLNRLSFDELRRWADERYNGSQFAISMTAIYAALDNHPRLAVDLMRIAFDRPSGFALSNLWHPAMAEARKTDAFEKLVTDLGLVKAWRESGDWGDYCRPVSAREITCI